MLIYLLQRVIISLSLFKFSLCLLKIQMTDNNFTFLSIDYKKQGTGNAFFRSGSDNVNFRDHNIVNIYQCT